MLQQLALSQTGQWHITLCRIKVWGHSTKSLQKGAIKIPDTKIRLQNFFTNMSVLEEIIKKNLGHRKIILNRDLNLYKVIKSIKWEMYC